MKVINMFNKDVWVDYQQGGWWEKPSAYQARGGAVIDTRYGTPVGNLTEFLRRRPNTIVVVTRDVAAAIDPSLLDQVRVPGVAAMIGGGVYAEPYNPHAQ